MQAGTPRPPTPPEDVLPLSPAQEGMLFHVVSEPGAGFYLIQSVVPLEGPVDAAALERAWQKLAARHVSLRSAFSWKAGARPVQAVLAAVTVPFETEDLLGLDPPARAARWDALLAEDRGRELALNRAPLLRVRLVRFEAGAHRMLVTFQHLVLDGWSQARVFHELEALYLAERDGRIAALPQARSPREFLAWVKGRDAALAKAHWTEVLRDFRGPTPLGMDRPQAAHEVAGAPRERRVVLSGEQTRALKATAQAWGVTVNVLLQTAWALLLSRYSGEGRVLFGATVAGRSAPVAGMEELVGCFINTLPMVADVAGAASLRGLARALHRQLASLGDFEASPLTAIQGASEVPRGQPLFESIIDFTNFPAAGLRAADSPFDVGGAVGMERTSYPLTLFAAVDDRLSLGLAYDSRRFEDDAVERMGTHLVQVLELLAAGRDVAPTKVDILPAAERERLTSAWNASRHPASIPGGMTLHRRFEEQVLRTPDAVAIAFRERTLTFRELDARAQALAVRLRAGGVGTDAIVGVCVERSPETVVALLAVLKAGGAYLPLDPGYPAARLRGMLGDSGARVLITSGRAERWARETLKVAGDVTVVTVEAGPAPPTGSAFPDLGTPESAAYVIYTSGSSGTPKGVVVTHANVLNFMLGMDARLGTGGPRSFAALTSISFDISVLELLWTLTRGDRVLLGSGEVSSLVRPGRSGGPSRRLDFSLFYFASDEDESARDKYRLLMEGAKFGDRHGFHAVWTPERHFHGFGGLFPNPAVLAAGIATATSRIHIRAGSVVSPLHDPIRIAEEWSVVDNLSGGRVGVSFAQGWHADDFVLAPERYADRKNQMLADLRDVRALWRGDALTRKGGSGHDVQVRLHPRPLQAALPVWLATTGTLETFRTAGALGAHVLTHLLGQRLEELPEKIRQYRAAWTEAGHPGEGTVTLMVHTFVGPTAEWVREKVRAPFAQYLRRSLDLFSRFAASVGEQTVSAERPEDLEAMIGRAVDRYLDVAGLFGTPEMCLELAERIRAAGVDELACLVDFGVPVEDALDGLHFLDEVRERASEARPGTFTEELVRHRVTDLQCTPSTAQAMLGAPQLREALRGLERMMVGGEALSPSLAVELSSTVAGGLYNMYGPTETTIWSSVQDVPRGGLDITLGTPLVNQALYVLDELGGLAPMGIPGELCIGGLGVTRGYLGRPALTAERFLPDQFSGRAGARLYRTGDLVRRRADGALQFLGRRDQQVKIRGHRIELGEIEARLLTAPGVREVAVTAREDALGNKSLVAYLVVTPPGPELAGLRRFLLETLPEVYVPSAFVALDALPLTPNGKVDRKALPAPDALRLGVTSRTPAATPREERLLRVYRDVLKTPDAGVEDDFFELGGDSLLTLHLSARSQKDGLPVTPAGILRYRTVRALAAALDADRVMAGSQAASAWVALPWPAQRAKTEPPQAPRHLGVRVPAGTTVDALRAALQALVARHDVFRARPGPAGWVLSPRAEIQVEVHALGDSAAESATLEQRLRAPEPPALVAFFDPGAAPGPLARIAVPGWLFDETSADLFITALGEALGETPCTVGSPSTAEVGAWLQSSAAAPSEELEHWRRESARDTLSPPGTEKDGVPRLGFVETFLLRALAEPGFAEASRRTRARPEELQAAALTLALAATLGPGRVRVWWTPSLRTVPSALPGLGQFLGALDCPVPLTFELSRTEPDPVERVKETVRVLPKSGLHWGPLAAQTPGLRSTPAALAVSFTSRLVWTGPVQRVSLGTVLLSGPTPVLQVVSHVDERGLVFRWAFDARAWPEATVNALAAEYSAALQRLLQVAVETGAAKPTPVDFPDAGLSQDKLDRFLASLGRGRSR